MHSNVVELAITLFSNALVMKTFKVSLPYVAIVPGF